MNRQSLGAGKFWLGRTYVTKTTVMREQCFTPFDQKSSSDSKYTRIIALRALIWELLIELSVSDPWEGKLLSCFDSFPSADWRRDGTEIPKKENSIKFNLQIYNKFRLSPENIENVIILWIKERNCKYLTKSFRIYFLSILRNSDLRHSANSLL